MELKPKYCSSCTEESRLKYTGGLKHHSGKEIIVWHTRHRQQENSEAVKKQVNFCLTLLQAPN
jgi:hypothetical protein